MKAFERSSFDLAASAIPIRKANNIIRRKGTSNMSPVLLFRCQLVYMLVRASFPHSVQPPKPYTLSTPSGPSGPSSASITHRNSSGVGAFAVNLASKCLMFISLSGRCFWGAFEVLPCNADRKKLTNYNLIRKFYIFRGSKFKLSARHHHTMHY